MELSNGRLAAVPEDERRAIVRPWLQDFTAPWIGEHLSYGEQERGKQIQGVYDAGLLQWLLWDPSVHYDVAGMSGSPGMTLKNPPQDSASAVED
jgi:hypothetical protein